MKQGLLFLFLLASLSLAAQNITGIWYGYPDLKTNRLRLEIQISNTDTRYTASLKMPDISQELHPAARVSVQGDTLLLVFPEVGVACEGICRSDSLVTGIIHWGQYAFPLELNRHPVVFRRPQTPQPPFPYRSEDVAIPNEADGITLAGTLTLPETTGKCKAVIIVSGSGAQDRNNTFFEHKTYLVLADYLSRQGIAVLRMDDRGVGQSEGNAATACLPDAISDTRAAIAYLKTRPEIHPDSIGIIGHSEGAFVAFTLAATGETPFIISLAGGGVNGSELLLMQRAALLKANGANDDFINLYNGYMRQAQDIVLQTGTPEACMQRLAQVLAGTSLAGQEASLTAQLFNPAKIELMKYDPAYDFQQIKCPVLALNGTKDCQVPIENLEKIKEGISANGNTHVTIISYPGLNHMFQPAQTGLPVEYSDIEETISPQVLKDIAQWLKALR